MSDAVPVRHGAKMKQGKVWLTCTSIPQRWPEGWLYIWRDGQRYVTPEWVDPAAERRDATRPLPVEPAPRFIIVPRTP